MARVPTLLIVSLLSAGAAFAQTAPPTQNSIRVVMNRVHGYLLTAAPLRPVDATTGAAVSLDSMPRNVALARTTLRIDSYEWGVTYAGMLLATQYTGDLRFRSYVRTNLIGLARMAAHMRANYPDCDPDNFPPALSSTYSLRRVLFPRIPDEAGAQCAAWIKASRAGIASARLRPWIDNYANWMSTQQYRLSDGTLARNPPMPNSVWLDDLYMGVPCLAQMALLTGDRRYFDDAAKQIIQFYSRMFVAAKRPVHARLDPGDESASGVPLGARQRMGVHGDRRVAVGAAEGSSPEGAGAEHLQGACRRASASAGAFRALAPVARSSGLVRGDVVERDVRIRVDARHQ